MPIPSCLEAPLDTTLNCQVQAKEKCIMNAQQLGSLLDVSRLLGMGTELICELQVKLAHFWQDS